MSKPRKRVQTSRLARIAKLGGMAARLAGNAAGAAGRLALSRAKAEEHLHLSAARTLVRALGDMKGLPMKLGQFLSYMDDHVPAEYRELYRDTLRELQVKAQPFAWEAMEGVIREDLGERADELIDGIDRTPIAAASIGQVYRARVGERDLAVKVQYPGIAEALRSDLKNAETVRSAMSVVFPTVDIDQTLADVSGRLLEECDYEHERRNQDELASLWQGHPDVLVPATHHDLSGRRVLVSDYVEGDDFYALLARADEAERSRIGVIICEFAFRSLYIHRVFNADPHPGNYVFLPDGRVAFIDFGCVQRFSRDTLASIVRVRRDIVAGIRGRPLWESITSAYDIPELDDELWGFLEEYLVASFEPLIAEQPYRYTRALTARFAKLGMDGKLLLVRKAFKLGVREAKTPGLVFLNRINYGLASILVMLEARSDWPAMMTRIDRDGGWD